MKIYIGIDDTDTLESRGTGWLARSIANDLSSDFRMLGVTRHQLLFDNRIPYTSHNSSACILLESIQKPDLTQLTVRVKALMMDDFQPGSDPGLCVVDKVPPDIINFGKMAKTDIITQDQARKLAMKYYLRLTGLGGSQDGVIGALAAIGLAASGEDGRYLMVGQVRELSGLQSVQKILAAGIHQVCTIDHIEVSDGLVLSDQLRPARRANQPVQFVTWQDNYWLPLKLD